MAKPPDEYEASVGPFNEPLLHLHGGDPLQFARYSLPCPPVYAPARLLQEDDYRYAEGI